VTTRDLLAAGAAAATELGIEQLVIVGDRGMISQKSIDEIRHTDGIDWITALKSGAIRMLIDDKHVQPDLFDERNLFEFTHPDFKGERLIACRNQELAKLRAHKRQDILQATQKDLEKIHNPGGGWASFWTRRHWCTGRQDHQQIQDGQAF
jgi:hypothetical protein